MNKTEQIVGGIVSYLVIVLFLVYVAFSIFGLNNEFVLLSALATIFLGTFLFCFFVIRAYRKNNKPNEIDYLNIGTQRYLLGIFMIFYGLPKLFGTFFDYQLFALDSKLVDVSEFELAWYYFGKNKWQEIFAGLMELVPGLLLLNRRTYYLGAIILLPVTSQVFILNLFFKIGGITFPAATVLLLCNLYIIYSQKEKIIVFINSLNFSRSENLGPVTLGFIKIAKWSTALIVLFLLYNHLKPIFYKSDQKIKYQKLVGAYSLKQVIKNNVVHTPEKDSLLYRDLYIEKQSRWNMLRRFNDETDAFIMNIGNKNDSLSLYINKGGAGDDKDVIDSATVLKGTYKLEDNLLKITGMQKTDTLELTYQKSEKIRPKKWFW